MNFGTIIFTIPTVEPLKPSLDYREGFAAPKALFVETVGQIFEFERSVVHGFLRKGQFEQRYSREPESYTSAISPTVYTHSWQRLTRITHPPVE